MDKANSPVEWWLRAISWVPGDGAVVQPSQNAVEPADFSFGGRVQVLGLPGVRHAADGVGRMLGLAPNGLDTLDAVCLDEAGCRRTGYRTRCRGNVCHTGTCAGVVAGLAGGSRFTVAAFWNPLAPSWWQPATMT